MVNDGPRRTITRSASLPGAASLRASDPNSQTSSTSGRSSSRRSALMSRRDTKPGRSSRNTRAWLLGGHRLHRRMRRRWDLDRTVAPSWWQFEEVMWGDVPVNRYIAELAKEWRKGLGKYFKRKDDPGTSK